LRPDTSFTPPAFASHSVFVGPGEELLPTEAVQCDDDDVLGAAGTFVGGAAEKDN